MTREFDRIRERVYLCNCSIQVYNQITMFQFSPNYNSNLCLSYLITSSYIFSPIIPAQSRQALLHNSTEVFYFSMNLHSLCFIYHVFTFSTFFIDHSYFYLYDITQLYYDLVNLLSSTKYFKNILSYFLYRNYSKLLPLELNMGTLRTYIYSIIQKWHFINNFAFDQYGE